MTWFRKKHPINKGKLNEMADTSEWSATCATFHHKYCKNKYKPYCKCPCHNVTLLQNCNKAQQNGRNEI